MFRYVNDPSKEQKRYVIEIDLKKTHSNELFIYSYFMGSGKEKYRGYESWVYNKKTKTFHKLTSE
jgi:hypothetical protein